MSDGVLNDCGCCEGVAVETPAPVENRDGLRTIAYRCGKYAQFKNSMLAALSASTRPSLRGLNTRDDDDFSIALLDAWACVADVLTFYQERIAQESYLRTANERVSLLELARLIGYELRPGVAASAYLAFTLDDAVGAPRATTIDIGTKVQSTPGPGEKAQAFETVEKIEARAAWNAIPARQTQPQRVDSNTKSIYLDGTATNLKKGDGLLLLDPGLPLGDTRSWAFVRVSEVTSDPAARKTFVELQARPTTFEPQQPFAVHVYVFRQRAALFGHNAPDPHILADTTLNNFATHIFPAGLPLKDFADWQFFPLTLSAGSVDLDATYPAIIPGDDSWLVLRRGDQETPQEALFKIGSVSEVGQKNFTLVSKVSRLTVSLTASPPVTDRSPFTDLALRNTTVFAQSERLNLAETPIDRVVTGATIVLARPVRGFQAGRVLSISGSEIGKTEITSSIVRLTNAAPEGAAFPDITFSPELVPGFDRTSVTINANVALATHGETVEEVLGSGDASLPYQQFTLRQPPLTFVRGTSASGADSTLRVRVNDLLWHEAASLFGHGPRDRVFVTHSSDAGATTLQFGDGVTGARPPSGQENVRATYRKGLGVDGLLKAGQLSMLMTRPLGVKAVTNPQDAEGAADRELLDDARSNASLTILTLDRIVSLQDYEDFVRAYAGISKALATWTWNGSARGVFVTVAGPGGAEIDMTGAFGASLLSAIAAAAEPFVAVRVQSYRRSAGLFRLAGSVKVDPDHESSRVLDAVRAAVRAAFSFDARRFGEPVTLSNVITVMQTTPGVLAVDVDALFRSDTPVGSTLLNARLLAAVPQAGTVTGISPAELLTLDPASLTDIGVMA